MRHLLLIIGRLLSVVGHLLRIFFCPVKDHLLDIVRHFQSLVGHLGGVGRDDDIMNGFNTRRNNKPFWLIHCLFWINSCAGGH